MKAKRTYKDSLFRDIFNDKRRLQQIYKALTGKLVPLKDIKITTLRGTFFRGHQERYQFHGRKPPHHIDGAPVNALGEYAAPNALVYRQAVPAEGKS